MLIGSKGNNYYSKVFKRVYYKLSNSIFWVVISFGDQITNKNTKTYTIWLEMIAKVINMLIELKGNNYYSKVIKRVN